MLYSPSAGLLDTNPPSTMFMISPAKAIIPWDQPDVRDSATNSWEEVIEAVDREREALQLLAQIIEHPKLDFQLDYRQGFSLLLPHLASFKRAAQHLSAASRGIT